MTVGIGIDIVEVKRIKEAVEKFSDKFLQRIFTNRELDYCERKFNRFQHYAVRFAAKEAMVKAVGTGLRNGITWHDIEVLNDGFGKPAIASYRKNKQLLKLLHVKHVHVSLTHSELFGAAVVILEK